MPRHTDRVTRRDLLASEPLKNVISHVGSDASIASHRASGRLGIFIGPLEVVTQTCADHVYARIVIEMHELTINVQLVEQVHGGTDPAEGIRG